MAKNSKDIDDENCPRCNGTGLCRHVDKKLVAHSAEDCPFKCSLNEGRCGWCRGTGKTPETPPESV
jgi:RecJ-like exonuclease